MQAEYLLFNLLIIAGPILSSFDRKVYFFQHWRRAFTAIFLVMIPFVIWDHYVTDKHWWFNGQFTLNFRLFELPPGEWLFFITVPFACIFVWHIMTVRSKGPYCRFCYLAMFIALALFILMMWQGKEYTACVLLAAAITIFLDFLLKTGILFQRKTLYFIIMLSGFILIFNGYLTARPVVLYNPKVQLNFRIITIPVEDFLYGYSLVFLCIIIFKRLGKGETER